MGIKVLLTEYGAVILLAKLERGPVEDGRGTFVMGRGPKEVDFCRQCS